MPRNPTASQGAGDLGVATARRGYGTLMPELEGDITNPEGYSDAEQAQMNTAVQQSAGGSNAGAVGEGALVAGRTRNPGSMAAAVAESTRHAGEEAQKNALGIKVKSADLAQSKRSDALQSLGQVTQGALGEVAPNVQAETDRRRQGSEWWKSILQAAGGAAGSFGGKH